MVDCSQCGNSFLGATGKLSADIIIDDRYIIVKVLGRGGMGAVYQALDLRLNKIPVAIKEMNINGSGEINLPAALEAFKQEAAMLISLRHPALPNIRDFFSKGNNRWYLVMDYIEGENLKSVAERRGPIPQVEVLEWAKQLCEILEFLHGQKPPVIFRDLKPANIMLTPENKIKLIDFGIARHFSNDKIADLVAYGSQGFAPPEQYDNNQLDTRLDIYALGAILHFLLTGLDPGKKPFLFEPPSKYVKILPEFEEALTKALEFNPQNRFVSVGELLNSFEKASKALIEECIPKEPELELNSNIIVFQQDNNLPVIFYLAKKLILGAALALILISFLFWVGVWDKAEFEVGQEPLGFPAGIVQKITGWLDSNSTIE